MKIFVIVILSLYIACGSVFAEPTYYLEDRDGRRATGHIDGSNLIFGNRSISLQDIAWQVEDPNITVEGTFDSGRPIAEQIVGSRACHLIRSFESDFGTVHEYTPRQYCLGYKIVSNPIMQRTELRLSSRFEGEEEVFATQLWHSFSHKQQQIDQLEIGKITYSTAGDEGHQEISLPVRYSAKLNSDTLVYITPERIVQKVTMTKHDPNTGVFRQWAALNDIEEELTSYQQVNVGDRLEELRALPSTPPGYYCLGQLVNGQPSTVYHQEDHYFLVGHRNAIPMVTSPGALQDQVVQFFSNVQMVLGDQPTFQAVGSESSAFLAGYYTLLSETKADGVLFQTWQHENGSEVTANLGDGSRIFEVADLSQALIQTPVYAQNCVDWLSESLREFNNLTSLKVKMEGFEDDAKKRISNGLLDLMKKSAFKDYAVIVDQLLTDRTMSFADLKEFERRGIEPEQLSAESFSFVGLNFRVDEWRVLAQKWLSKTEPNFHTISFKGCRFRDGGAFLSGTIGSATKLEKVCFDDATFFGGPLSSELVSALNKSSSVIRISFNILPDLDYTARQNKEFLAKVYGLKRFDVEGLRFGSSFYHWARLLARNKETLELVRVCNTHIDDPNGFTNIILGLHKLTYLNVLDTNLKNHNLRAIYENMPHWPYLKTLFMDMVYHYSQTGVVWEEIEEWLRQLPPSLIRMMAKPFLCGTAMAGIPLLELYGLFNGDTTSQYRMIEQLAKSSFLKDLVLKRDRYIPFGKTEEENALERAFKLKRQRGRLLPCMVEFKA